jgi:hypothetical protein
MLRVYREELANEVNLAACDVVVAHRTGVRDEIDVVEHGLPPVGVHLDTHGPSGGV